jgi:hypothetical protein
MPMPTPTITKHSTRPAVGLTGKGRAYLALAQVRDRWHEFSDDQKQEVADLVARLSVALRARPTLIRGFVRNPSPAG